jgi:hypothetical protein
MTVDPQEELDRVWMANPFSAVPSAFKVHSRGLTYFARR